MEAQVSETLLIAQNASVSNLCQDLSITHFFVLTSSMNALIIKQIHMITQTQNSEVNNAINRNHAEKVYYVLSRNHAGESKSHSNKYVQPNSTS